jgi:hypothetical protein
MSKVKTDTTSHQVTQDDLTYSGHCEMTSDCNFHNPTCQDDCPTLSCGQNHLKQHFKVKITILNLPVNDQSNNKETQHMKIEKGGNI